jgi:hypothetical protein
MENLESDVTDAAMSRTGAEDRHRHIVAIVRKLF